VDKTELEQLAITQFTQVAREAIKNFVDATTRTIRFLIV
jgi:hypothetical protein